MSSPTDLPTIPYIEPGVRDRVCSVLDGMGLTHTDESDGDIGFEVNGQRLYARTRDDGPGMVRVFGQWQIMDNLPGEPALRYAAAHQTTATHALVKVSVLADTLLVAVDAVCPPGSRVDVIVSTSIEAVLSAVTVWHRIIVGDPPDGQVAASGDDPSVSGDGSQS